MTAALDGTNRDDAARPLAGRVREPGEGRADADRVLRKRHRIRRALDRAVSVDDRACFSEGARCRALRSPTAT